MFGAVVVEDLIVTSTGSFRWRWAILRITDGMVAEAAYALAELTLAKHGTERLIYPPVSDLREAAALVAARVARRAIADGVARETDTTDLEARARRLAWKPDYLPVRRASGGAVLVGG